MNRTDLIKELSLKLRQLPHQDVELAVKTILSVMAQSLADHDRIEIRGFGSFKVNQQPPRVGRNPKTGELIDVPAKPRVAL